MFSPVGTKKVMLENYRRSLSSGESVSTMLSKDNLSVNNSTTKNSSSPSFKRGTSMESFLSDMSDASITSSTSSSSSPLRIAQKGQYNFIRNHYELKKLLKETSLRGQVIQKIANIAMKFDKERDGILLNAFDTNYLNYEDFRILLKRILNIELTNEEFQELCQLLDNQQQHIINGVEFLIILTILSNHKKNQKRQKNYQEKRQNEQNSLKVQQNKQLARMTSIEEAAIDYSGNSNDLEKGLEKVHDAAARYDRTHHTAKSLKAFERAYMTPIEFRDALKGTFDITLTPKELGALVMHYSTGMLMIYHVVFPPLPSPPLTSPHLTPSLSL